MSPADGPDTNSVSFYTVPWYTGSITFDGTTYYDTDFTSVADGTYNIVANVPAGFTFSQWRYSGGVSVANPSAAATTCSVSDNGWLEMVLSPADGPDITVTPMSLDFGLVEVGSSSSTENVTVTNEGAANLIIGNLSINNNQFSVTSGNISDQTLIPGASANITVGFTPGSTGAHSANLTIPSNDADENPVNVLLSGNGTEPPTTEADLEITKTDSPDPVAFGDNLTYTLTVINHGPSNATSVNVTDVLYPYLVYVSSNTSAGSVNATTDFPYWSVNWDIGNLASGDNVTLDIVATINPLLPIFGIFTTMDTISNIATVTGNEDDPNIDNNTASEDTGLLTTDLEITKTDKEDPVMFGDNITWYITVTNNGPLDATDVVALDLYTPGFITIKATEPSTGTVSQTPPQWLDDVFQQFGANITSISGGLSVLYWDIGDLASGASANLTIIASDNLTSLAPANTTWALSPAVAGFLSVISGSGFQPPEFPYPNLAGVLSTTLDSDASNNMVVETTTLSLNLPETDLEITKTDDPDPVASDGSVTYTVNIKNNGPEDAPNVYVFDTWLASSLILQSVTPSVGTTNQTIPQWLLDVFSPGGGTPTIGDNYLWWEVGPLPSGASANLTIVAIVNVTLAMQTPYIYNAAMVFGDVRDIDPSNNIIMVDTSIGVADLEISKTDSPDPVAFGDNLTYTLTVTNNSPVPAAGARVIDNLPDGTTFLSANPSTGTYTHSSGNVTWDIGDITAGNTVNMTIVVTAPSSPGDITNTATVSGSYFDPVMGNNIASANTTPVPPNSADLVITKTDSPDPVATGGNLTYTVTVTNNGPADMGSFTVSDDLPDSVLFQSANASIGTAYESTGIVYWNIDSLNSGSSVNMTITVTAPLETGIIINYAEILGEYAEAIPGNEFVSENTTVALPTDADLEITKTGSPDPVYALEDLTYVLTVTNNGPADATSVNVTDTLPPGVTYKSSVPTGNFNSANGTVSWNLGNLAAGANTTLTIIASAPGVSGDITNTAVVSGAEQDPVPGNNEATATTKVDKPIIIWLIDLAIEKTDSQDPVLTGDNLTYTLTVTNKGLIDTVGVTVTDNLPPEATYQTHNTVTGTASHTSGNVTWNIGSLATGDSANLTITVTAPTEEAVLRNVASVTGTADIDGGSDDIVIEINPFDNTAIEFTTVLTSINTPDITVTPMSVNFGSINVGSTSATRTVTVSNNGTANLIIGNLTINNNQFAITSGNISGQTLGPSASANITLTFAPGSTGTHSANLTIPSNDPDENPVNVPLSGSGTTSPQPPPHFTGSSPAQPAPNYFTVDFLGKITQELATNDGRPIKRMEAPSPDDTHLLEIEEYTGATDNTGSIVTLIEIREAVAPEFPENTRLVGKALEFKPTGTAFDKSIRLTLGYNVNDLPENVVSVGAAYFSVKDGWIYLQTETTSVAELGKLTAPVDHFTVFAVLAEVAIPVPPEPTPPAPPEPTPPAPPEPLPAPAPALFTLSKLSITTSVTRYYENVSYVVRTGEEALITVDVTNNGGQPGSYTAILIINGEERDRKEVALEPGQTGTVSFTITDNEPGTYDVVIGNLAGDFLSKLWINWWLAAGSTAALILIIWLVWYLIKRKRQQI